MNLGNPSGVELQDDERNIDENYRRLQAVIGIERNERCSVHQVHGAQVVRVVEGGPHDRKQKADVLVTTDARRVLSVRVADCVPVLMASADGRVVAAVHAGWRGVITGAVPAALKEMGVSPSQIMAGVGPSIGQNAFEVGPEVVAEFERVFGTDNGIVRRRDDGKGHVDLKGAIRQQLLQAGVQDGNIDVTDRCSYRDAEEFFSHRRDNGVTGRMAALIGVKA
jgi:hypothetical protein